MTEEKLTKNMEDYLEAIYILQRKHGVATITGLSEFLNVRKPSVNSALHFLSEKGLVNYQKYQKVTVTEYGDMYAKKIYHRHITLKNFLMEILNVEESKAEENACRMEHVIDEDIFTKVSNFLEFVIKSNISCVDIKKFKIECDED